MRRWSCLLVLFALAGPAHGEPRLSAAEALTLLEVGVSESEIVAVATRLGGFDPARSEDLEALRIAGASDELIGRIPRTSLDVGALAELARQFDVFRDPEFGVTFLFPAGWNVQRTKVGTDGVMMRITPQSVGIARPFVDASMFVLVHRRSGLLPEVAESVMKLLQDMTLRTLRSRGVDPRPVEIQEIDWMGTPAACNVVEASLGRSGTGVLGVCLRLETSGQAVGIGYSSGPGDRDRTVEAFRQLAKTMSLTAPK